MEVVVPIPIDLARTGASPTFIYSLWAAGVYYPSGAVVRLVCGGISYDYRCKYGHTSTTSPSCSWNTYFWTRVGLSGTTGGWTYSTSVRLSNAASWATGTAIAANDIRFDDATSRDYRATLALTTGQNTIRPSAALVSSDELTRQRWVDLGAANAWAPFDYRIDSRLQGWDSSGNLLSSVVFTFGAGAGVGADRITFAGLRNISQVTAKVYHEGSLVQTVIRTLTGSTHPLGQTPDTTSLTITGAATTVASVTVEITLAQGPYTTRPIECGVIVMGIARELGTTHLENLEVTVLPFSTIDRDPVFGTTAFIKRGAAKVIRAQLSFDPRTLPRYAVLNFLRDVQGVPVWWDFNNGPGNEFSLRVFGFQSRQSIQPVATSHEVLTLDVEGLVE